MSNTIRLEYLTNEAIQGLKAEFHSNKEHYLDKDNGWFLNFLAKNNGMLESKIECDDFVEKLNMDSDFSKSDFENVKIIYSALKNLSPAEASDERLWSGLAHGRLWGFVKYRRGKELESNEDMEIKNSFFFMRGKRRSLYINCLSRLWWTGYLTYDETRTDPYELTKLICEKAYASRILLLSSNNFVSRKETIIGLLSGISKIKARGQDIKRTHFVTPCKYINNMGAITIIDTLERDEIKKIVESVLRKEFDIS